MIAFELGLMLAVSETIRSAPAQVVSQKRFTVELRDRTALLLARTAVAVRSAGAPATGWDGLDGSRALPDRRAAAALLELASEAVMETLRTPDGRDRAEVVGLAELLCDLQVLGRDLREHAVHERLDALADVSAGLARLRAIGSSAQILQKATEEVCRSCCFDRAMLSRINGDRVITESVFYEGDAAGAALLLELGRRWPRRLVEMKVEAEIIRRRRPIVVDDARKEARGTEPMVEGSGTRSYVAVPIMPSGRVIGFIHADCRHQGRRMDAFDRDLLWAFAESFGHLYERAVVVERLRSQRDDVRRMVWLTEEIMEEICEATVEVERSDREDTASAARAAAMIAPSGPSSGLGEVLTRREREIIRLMASGETNAGIATRLVITEGTVKSHVKHILRKLRASNRAEAVSRYLMLPSEASRGERLTRG